MISCSTSSNNCLLLMHSLVPDGKPVRGQSPKAEQHNLYSHKVTENEIKREVRKALIKKQDTEEEDIDELVRTFKESEAAVPKDSGDQGM